MRLCKGHTATAQGTITKAQRTSEKAQGTTPIDVGSFGYLMSAWLFFPFSCRVFRVGSVAAMDTVSQWDTEQLFSQHWLAVGHFSASWAISIAYSSILLFNSVIVYSNLGLSDTNDCLVVIKLIFSELSCLLLCYYYFLFSMVCVSCYSMNMDAV